MTIKPSFWGGYMFRRRIWGMAQCHSQDLSPVHIVSLTLFIKIFKLRLNIWLAICTLHNRRYISWQNWYSGRCNRKLYTITKFIPPEKILKHWNKVHGRLFRIAWWRFYNDTGGMTLTWITAKSQKPIQLVDCASICFLSNKRDG